MLQHNAFACQSHRWPICAGAWATEVLSVLAPLVQASQEAAEQLLTLGGLHALAPLLQQPEREPLPLSMMLDIVEVLVSRGDAAATEEVRQMLVRDGLLAPILHALHHHSLNRQAIAILCHMAEVRSCCASCTCARSSQCRSMCGSGRCSAASLAVLLICLVGRTLEPVAA